MTQHIISILGIIAFSLFTISIYGQYGSYFGFKGGASVNSFQSTGFMPEESSGVNFGLNFGAIYGYRITDYFGFQTGIDYTAKGGKLFYNGDSKAVLHGADRDIIIIGTREMERNIKYHAITVPVQATIKPFSKLQVGLGVYGGIGVASKMSGFYKITDAFTENQTPLFDPYEINMSGTYFTDIRGPGSPVKNRPGFAHQVPTPETFSLEGELISYLKDSNPYDEYGPDTDRYLKRFDGGLYGSLEFYPRRGFVVGVSFSYQLSPLTNSQGDLDYKNLDEQNNFLPTNMSKKLWNSTLYFAFTF